MTSPLKCAPSYSPSDQSKVITGPGTLPKPSTFVTRSPPTSSNPNLLLLDNEPYRITGANVYWLGLDENIPQTSMGTSGKDKDKDKDKPTRTVGYPSKQRVREAMAIVVAMGGNTIRGASLGISVGNKMSVMPELGVWNEKAFDAIDYSIMAANAYGLRLIIPLVGNYDYFHGGKYTFLRWLGISIKDSNFGNDFFTNRKVIESFKEYIKGILERRNGYTGIRYNEDPTILAWEMGNEFGAYLGKEGYPPIEFDQEISEFIKSLAPKQLVLGGDDGFWNYSTKVSSPELTVPSIDMISDHLYPLNEGLLKKDFELVEKARKPFFVGEYDWTGQNGGQSLEDFFAQVESKDYVGDLVWSIFGHDDQCCDYIRHNDGFSMYYPNGNSPSLQNQILKVVQHFHRLQRGKQQSIPVPSVLPAVACPQPPIHPDDEWPIIAPPSSQGNDGTSSINTLGNWFPSGPIFLSFYSWGFLGIFLVGVGIYGTCFRVSKGIGTNAKGKNIPLALTRRWTRRGGGVRRGGVGGGDYQLAQTEEDERL